MRNRHITRFGSPLARSGALYGVFDEEGLIQMAVDMKLVQLHARGIFITPEMKSLAKSDVKQSRAEYHDEVKHAGVPDKLKLRWGAVAGWLRYSEKTPQASGTSELIW